MLTEYLKAAMARANYEMLDGEEGFYGEIPGFEGVLAQAEKLEACREELASTLEDWLLFRISRQLPIPVLDGWISRSRNRRRLPDAPLWPHQAA